MVKSKPQVQKGCLAGYKVFLANERLTGTEPITFRIKKKAEKMCILHGPKFGASMV